MLFGKESTGKDQKKNDWSINANIALKIQTLIKNCQMIGMFTILNALVKYRAHQALNVFWLSHWDVQQMKFLVIYWTPKWQFSM